MARDHEELLWNLEDRLSTVSRWLAARRIAGARRAEQLRAHLESARRELRRNGAHSVHAALARARATLDDMDRELAAPPADATIHREELDAMRHHLRVTGTLLPHVYNLDDPGWLPAHEEYERSWDEVVEVIQRGATPPR